MPKLRPAKPEEVQRILEKDIAKGTLRKIIKDLEITVEEFEALR